MATNDLKRCVTCDSRYGAEAAFCPKDGTPLVRIESTNNDPFIDREILGHIQIRALIGAGAMGRVYRAFQRSIERDVAVKILHKELAQNNDLVGRFLREAKVASKLNHPNVVQVLLAGQLEDQTMYLVMEYIDGVSLLAALNASSGIFPLQRALRIALQVCDAVGDAHQVGVVHRDVKPENIMLVRRSDEPDFVKVLDFGIARLGETMDASSVQTQAGLVFGTARYLSPEGARGERVGPPSDVYAIATVLYQMLAGQTPFEHDSAVSLLIAQIHDVPPPLHTLPHSSYVPFAIESLILRNLSKDPSMRDSDAHTFGRNLLNAAISCGFSHDDLLVKPAVAKAHNRSTPVRPEPLSPEVPFTYPRDSMYTPTSPRVGVEPRVSLATPQARFPGQTVAMPLFDTQPHELTEFSYPNTESTLQLSSDSTDFTQELDESSIGIRHNLFAKIALGFVLFGCLGVLGFGGYKLFFTDKQPTSTNKQQEVEQLVNEAQAALEAKHWDSPKGSNVLELTDRILSISPDDARAYRIRNNATGLIIIEGIEQKSHKNLAKSLQLLRLAQKLSPNEKGIQIELEDLEAEAASDPDTANLVTDVGVSRYAAKISIANSKALVATVGESIEFVALINDGAGMGTYEPKELDQKAHFNVKGPGIEKSIFVDAQATSATHYSARFTFKNTGTHKVYFFARPDRFPVKAVVDIVVSSHSTNSQSVTTRSSSKPVSSVPTAPTTTSIGTSLVLDPPTTQLTVPLPPPEPNLHP